MQTQPNTVQLMEHAEIASHWKGSYETASYHCTSAAWYVQVQHLDVIYAVASQAAEDVLVCQSEIKLNVMLQHRVACIGTHMLTAMHGGKVA